LLRCGHGALPTPKRLPALSAIPIFSAGMCGGPILRTRLDSESESVSIIDEHTRECLGGMVERSITGEHLTAELDRLAGQRAT
jgi:hypothetical protein